MITLLLLNEENKVVEKNVRKKYYRPQKGFYRLKSGHYAKKVGDPRCITDFEKIEIEKKEKEENKRQREIEARRIESQKAWKDHQGSENVVENFESDIYTCTTKISFHRLLQCCINYSHRVDKDQYILIEPTICHLTGIRGIDRCNSFEKMILNDKLKQVKCWFKGNFTNMPDTILMDVLI